VNGSSKDLRKAHQQGDRKARDPKKGAAVTSASGAASVDAALASPAIHRSQMAGNGWQAKHGNTHWVQGWR
jgi:hypothetical protein